MCSRQSQFISLSAKYKADLSPAINRFDQIGEVAFFATFVANRFYLAKKEGGQIRAKPDSPLAFLY